MREEPVMLTPKCLLCSAVLTRWSVPTAIHHQPGECPAQPWIPTPTPSSGEEVQAAMALDLALHLLWVGEWTCTDDEPEVCAYGCGGVPSNEAREDWRKLCPGDPLRWVGHEANCRYGKILALVPDRASKPAPSGGRGGA